VPVSLVRNDERLAGVGHGAVDVALLRGVPGAPGMRVVRLGEEGRVAAVPVSSHLARRKRLSWAELTEHPLVMNTVSGVTTTQDWPEDNRPSATVSCGNFDEWLELVAAGRGIGVAPELVLRRRLHPAVRFIPLYGAPTVPLSLVHPVQGADPLAQRFVDVAGLAFADHHRRHPDRQRPLRRPLRPAGAGHGQPGSCGLREKAVSPAVATIASWTSSTRGG
jgi:DNA-binding transcriptional LysR family regulator